MGEMAMSAYDVMSTATDALEAGLYGALDGCDQYQAAIETLLAEEHAKDEPNAVMVKRLNQFQARLTKIASFVEDDALTEFVFLRDRLFSVDQIDKGQFI